MKSLFKTIRVFVLTLIVLVMTACSLNPSSSSSSSISSSSSSSSSLSSSSVAHALEGQSIAIHYYRYDNDYSGWALWLWERNKDGAEYQFNENDSYGAVAKVSLTTWSKDLLSNDLGFIVKTKGSWGAKDVESDRYIKFSELVKDSSNTYNIYLKTGDATIYKNAADVVKYDILSCAFTSSTEISFTTSSAISNYKVYENDAVIANVDVTTQGTSFKFTFEDKEVNLSSNYKVEVSYQNSTEKVTKGVDVNKLYSTKEFDTQFTYDGNDLGAVYEESKTTFKVWSPVSSNIKLRLYDSGTPKAVDSANGDDTIVKELEMTKGEKGVWSVEVEGNLEGKYYTYVVTNSKFTNQEIVDPYAKSTGVNGLRGMIVDFTKTNPEGWENVSPHQYDRKELTVWETHVADVTSSSTWNGTESFRKKFLGLQEEGTTYTKGDVTVKTGFDHIKELGVNAVQLIPIYDQANDEINPSFNWGYNPLNYNALEGSYSTNPYDGYVRIKEFKQVVQKFNEAGINIIMDVVYNHMANASGSNFDVLVPGYYFRYSANGSLSNGSGCGNETASEMPMFRKFMIDSTSFWAEEYKLGGFRFDLMGLHDIETMNQLTAKCQTINPAITIYGEPWRGGTSTLQTSYQAIQDNGDKYVGYGQFNDRMRDELIKGGLSAASAKSWISNKTSNTASMSKLMNGIKGITDTGAIKIDPDKTVNYVTCHDNYTLYDRFKAAGITDETDVKRMAMLANSVVFTSQGTTFMLAGEEFLRTKGGNHNSYDASYEVNELNYELKVDHLDMFQNYQKLIALKQDLDGLHLDGTQVNNLIIENRESNNLLFYKLTDSENGKEYVVIHSNAVNADTRKAIDLTGYTLYLDTLGELEGELGEVTPKAFQTIIAYK